MCFLDYKYFAIFLKCFMKNSGTIFFATLNIIIARNWTFRLCISAHKITKFQLISSCENFVDPHSLRVVLGNSRRNLVKFRCFMQCIVAEPSLSNNSSKVMLLSQYVIFKQLLRSKFTLWFYGTCKLKWSNWIET